jgi:hypothetical protein
MFELLVLAVIGLQYNVMVLQAMHSPLAKCTRNLEIKLYL